MSFEPRIYLTENQNKDKEPLSIPSLGKFFGYVSSQQELDELRWAL